MSDTRVLVTGGSGFIGSHCVAALLNEGYWVRATVRSSDREPDVRDMVARAGADAEAQDRLTFAVADLTSDDGWSEAIDGSEFVLHVASPFPPDDPADDNRVIVPACEGTIRVLRAARNARVRRVVLTSSFAAIGYGHGKRDRVFTEEDWTNIDGRGVSTYVKSKVLAERAAWGFVKSGGGKTESPIVGDVLYPSNRKAKAVLGFDPRPIGDALLSTAGSLVRAGLVAAP